MSQKKLTAQQRLFIHEYLIDLNASQAAIRAGYSETSARSTSSDLMADPRIKVEIQAGMDKRAEKIELTAEWVLAQYLKIAKVDIAECFNPDGSMKLIHDIPEDVRRSIDSIEVDDLFEGTGQDRFQKGHTRKIKFSPKIKALNDLGRHLVLFTDKIEHDATAGLAAALAKARKRTEK